MSSIPIIRPAVASDLRGMLLLLRHLNPADPETEPTAAAEVWRRMLATHGMTVFLAELPGVDHPVATCTLLVAPNLTRGARPQALIENVVTHADYRRQGLGRAILDAAVNAAWQAGCYRVTLTTGSKREETLRFYERAGFKRNTKTAFEMRRAGF